MIDYGLVAYNRSEESIKQNLKIKYDSNFIRYFYFILSNTKTEVAKVKTSKQTLVKLKLTCNTDCVCEVYVNNNIEYAFNVVDSAECYLKLDGECKIELKLKKSTNVMINTSIVMVGEFKSLYEKDMQFYINGKYYYIIFSKDNQKYKVSASSTTDLISKFNANNINNFLNYACGMATPSGFYHINKYYDYCAISGPNGETNMDVVVSDLAVCAYDNDGNNMLIFEPEYDKLKIISLKLNGEVNFEKTFNLPSGIYIKKLFPIINHKFVNYVPGFLICDVNSQIYMVLCNNQNLTNSSHNLLNCIALSVKGYSACGYCLDNKYYIEINDHNLFTEVILQNNINEVKKLEEKTSFNISNKFIINNSKSILNFNDYMVEHDVS